MVENEVTKPNIDTDMNLFKKSAAVFYNTVVLRMYDLNDEYYTVNLKLNDIIEAKYVSDGEIRKIRGRIVSIVLPSDISVLRKVNMSNFRTAYLELDISETFHCISKKIYLYDIREIKVIKSENIESVFKDPSMPVKPNPYEKDMYAYITNKDEETGTETMIFTDEPLVDPERSCKKCRFESCCPEHGTRCYAYDKIKTDEEVVFHLHASLQDIREYFIRLDPDNEDYKNNDDSFLDLTKLKSIISEFCLLKDEKDEPPVEGNEGDEKPDLENPPIEGGDNEENLDTPPITGEEDDNNNSSTEGGDDNTNDSGEENESFKRLRYYRTRFINNDQNSDVNNL